MILHAFAFLFMHLTQLSEKHFYLLEKKNNNPNQVKITVRFGVILSQILRMINYMQLLIYQILFIE